MTTVDAGEDRVVEPESGAGAGDADLQISRVGDVIVVSASQVALPDVLSESERAVALALLEGQSNAEIASARGTSTKTVANQLYAIYRKLGAGSREELVAILAGASPASNPSS